MKVPDVVAVGLRIAAVGLLSGCIHDPRDLHEATALPERQPTTLRARTYPVCSLAGPRNADPGVYGTDLGLTVALPNAPGKVSDRLAMLFGDTWARATDACKYPLSHSDDLQAWLPLHPPSELRAGPPGRDAANACRLLEYPLGDRADVTSWSRIRLFEVEPAPRSGPDRRDSLRLVDTGMLRAPNGAFSDGKAIYVMYGSDAVSCDRSRDCPESLLCTKDPTYSGKRVGECSGTRAGAGDGTPLYCRDGSDCPPAGKCDKPAHGVCVSTRPFDVRTPDGVVSPRWYVDDPRRGIARTRLVGAAIWPDRPSDYAVVARFPTNRFQNVATRTVRYFDPEDPSQNDYRPGHHTLLMWGRAGYAEKGGSQALPFLLYQPLEGWGQGAAPRRWSPRFFAGYAANGLPRWSDHESEAVPIYGASAKVLEAAGGRLEWSEPEFDYVNQMTMSYVAPLGRFVMLYGGDDPAFIVLDPATGTAPAPVHLQRSPGAIHMRVASHPWGRALRDSPESDGFTSPEPVLTREVAAPYLACGRGGPKELPGCLEKGDPHGPLNLFGALASLSTKVTPGAFADVAASCLGGEFAMTAQMELSGNPIGRLYGVNIIDEWTSDVSDGAPRGGRSAEIYWNASTWNPYQVVLFKTVLLIPQTRDGASPPRAQ